jgi:hypothetical protein
MLRQVLPAVSPCPNRTYASRRNPMISSVDLAFRAMSSSPFQRWEIAGFARGPWYQFREADQSHCGPQSCHGWSRWPPAGRSGLTVLTTDRPDWLTTAVEQRQAGSHPQSRRSCWPGRLTAAATVGALSAMPIVMEIPAPHQQHGQQHDPFIYALCIDVKPSPVR